MKELYRFRQFLTEGVIKENIMVSPIIMFGGKKYIEDVISSPDDFGFDKDDAEWVKNNILSSPKMVSIQDYMDLDDKWVKQAQIDTSGGGALDHVVDGLKIHVKQELITPEQEKEAMKVVGLSEGRLLKENAPGYDTRKFGESLPTMESVKAAYEAKKEKEDEKVEEVSSREGSRIEGLLNQQLKSKFLTYFEELFYDLVEEEVFPVEDVIDHLSMEMTKRIYGKPLMDMTIDEEDSKKKPLPKPVAKDLKKMKTNFSDLKKRLKLEE